MHAGTDLEQPVKEDDAVQLVLCVSLPDDERQRDCGRQFVAAVGLWETRLSEEGRSGRNKVLPEINRVLKPGLSGGGEENQRGTAYSSSRRG